MKRVKVVTVKVKLKSDKKVMINLLTQSFVTTNLSLKEIDEANELLAKWQKKHKL